MNMGYFYTIGVKDGKKILEGPKSYKEALVFKTSNIFEKYGKKCAEEYREGLYSIIVPYKKKSTR